MTSLQTDVQQALNHRQAFSVVPTPLVVAAALVDGQPAGMMIGSFVTHSLTPGLVSISVQRNSSSWPKLRDASEIGISLISEKLRAIIPEFYRPSHERFSALEWDALGTAVMLDDAPLSLVTEVVEEIDAGDHLLVMLKIIRLFTLEDSEAEQQENLPIVFQQSIFRSMNQ